MLEIVIYDCKTNVNNISSGSGVPMTDQKVLTVYISSISVVFVNTGLVVIYLLPLMLEGFKPIGGFGVASSFFSRL